jgi:hypothetical protein
MTFDRDLSTRGLWRDPKPAVGGVHALIIGISDYPHLDGGSGPIAPSTGGMGQLEVSALTAARIFNWLRARGAAGGAPLKSCRLLLAPCAAERPRVDALTSGWYADATFSSVEDMTVTWADRLVIGADEPGPNVAFFFFSGHGAEHISQPSLMAMDILDTRTVRGPKYAIALNSLLQSVRTFGVDRALFFVDACRTAPEVIKRLNIIGQPVLDPLVDAKRSPEALVWLQATQRGASAYQVSGAQATIFGQGLLDGLEGLAPTFEPYNCDTNPWTLEFQGLERFVKLAVRAILAQHSATKLQPVEPGGNPYNGDALVAERIPAPGHAMRPQSPPPHPPSDSSVVPPIDIAAAHFMHVQSDDILRTFRPIPAGKVRELRLNDPVTGDLADLAVMHEILGHEGATVPWAYSVRVLDKRTGEPLGPGVVRIVEAHRIEIQESITAWIDLRIAPGEGRQVWIQAGGGGDGRPWFAVTIPRDLYGPIPVRLDISLKPEASLSQWHLESMSARLAPSDQPDDRAGHDWGALWEAQRIETFVDLARAGRAAINLDLERALEQKMLSPVGAAIGAALLLRAGDLQFLHDWPRNLANWFPWLADGPVLWSETLLRRGGFFDAHPEDAYSGDGNKEAFEFFLRISERGLPVLTSVLGMAARQASYFRRVFSKIGMSSAENHQLARIEAAIDRASTFALPAGLFATFSSDQSVFGLGAVFGNTIDAESTRAAEREA